MMIPLVKSANLLASCALLGLGAAAEAQPAPQTASPREWLEKMNSALAQRNYDGTFLHLSGGRVETMRIVHRVVGGEVTERLMSLDGSGREFVRNSHELTCYLPDKNTILVEPRQSSSPFFGSLPQFSAGAEQVYQLDTLPTIRVLGRTTQGIAITPKDKYRFGYRLWLDQQTGMPLKTQLCDSSGQLIEQIQFAHLEMPDSIPDSALSPSMPLAGMQVIRQAAHDETVTKGAGFRTIHLPPGFHLLVAGARALGGSGDPVMHLVFSDGLATVSVFVEPGVSATPQPAEQEQRVGSGYAYTTIVQGHQVTAVGEVPAETVEFIAHSVRLDNSAPH
jgi:sigma-E factor negative regulatory protein RseB